MKYPLNISVRLIAFSITGLVLSSFTSAAAPLVVSNYVSLAPGTYHYDSVTIQPQGTLGLTGDTTFNVDGDFTMQSSQVTNIYIDPDFGYYVTNYYIASGLIDISRNEGLSGGTNGAAGSNGQAGTTNGQITGASQGGAGQPGGWGGIKQSTLVRGHRYFGGYPILINAGDDINFDGQISAIFLPGGGFGGQSGTR